MNLPIPDFVPIPNAETMAAISIVLLIAGICLVGFGVIFLFLCKRKGKKTTTSWICICAGILLVANHGIQLLLKL